MKRPDELSPHMQRENQTAVWEQFCTVLQDAEYDIMSLKRQTLGLRIPFKL